MEFWLHSAEKGLLSMSLAACSNISFQTKFKLYKVIKSTKTQKKEVLAVGVLEFSVVETSMSHRRMEVSTLETSSRMRHRWRSCRAMSCRSFLNMSILSC